MELEKQISPLRYEMTKQKVSYKHKARALQPALLFLIPVFAYDSECR
jgi:hypothetical protein